MFSRIESRQAICVVDLVVDRDHDGNGRMLHIVKVQLSVFQVTGADLEISTDPVSSVLREIQLSVFSRMETVFLKYPAIFLFLVPFGMTLSTA